MRPFLEEVGISDLFEKSKADLSDIADDALYGLVHLLIQNQLPNPPRVQNSLDQKFLIYIQTIQCTSKQ